MTMTSMDLIDIMLLSHSPSFEAKLSGNFCDCLSNGIPFISRKTAPELEWSARYGDLGFFVNFDDDSWVQEFLVNFSICKLDQIKKNLKAAMGDDIEEKVLTDLNNILEVKS